MSVPTCRFFASKKGCSFGDQCHFSHAAVSATAGGGGGAFHQPTTLAPVPNDLFSAAHAPAASAPAHAWGAPAPVAAARQPAAADLLADLFGTAPAHAAAAPDYTAVPTNLVRLQHSLSSHATRNFAFCYFL